MATKPEIESTDEAWEKGELGRDENQVRVSTGVDEAKIDASLGLRPVSIRLQQSLIDDFKQIAKLHGLGYQPLMRQVLTRFADCEKKMILNQYIAQQLGTARAAEGDCLEPEPVRKRA